MKILLTTIFSLITIVGISRNYISGPIVDERVELLCIVFRLAGAEEYSKTNIKNYSKAIDIYFNSYKEDELIKYIKTIRKKNSIGYDAVMSMAVFIEIDSGIVKFKESIEKQNLDSRWGNFSENFIILLNKFYKKTDFHKFYSDNENLYSVAMKRFSDVINKIDFNWFEKFYGDKTQYNYNLIIILASSGGNYGPEIKYQNGKEDIYSMICTWNIDTNGFPVFSPDAYIGTIIHEFSHSYCNHLIDQNYSKIESAAKGIFRLVKRKMQKQAYGEPLTMEYETLVRASVIRYQIDHVNDEKQILQLIGRERYNGFILIDSLVALLGKYENDSIKYKSLEDFMPEIVKMHNSLTPKEFYKVKDCFGPKIVSFSIENNCQDVDPNIKEIVIVFDRPMSKGYGINNGKGGKKNFPEITTIKWNEVRNNELIISVKLFPDKKYSLKFPDHFLLDENYCNMQKTYYLNFKTRK